MRQRAMRCNLPRSGRLCGTAREAPQSHGGQRLAPRGVRQAHQRRTQSGVLPHKMQPCMPDAAKAEKKKQQLTGPKQRVQCAPASPEMGGEDRRRRFVSVGEAPASPSCFPSDPLSGGRLPCMVFQRGVNGSLAAKSAVQVPCPAELRRISAVARVGAGWRWLRWHGSAQRSRQESEGAK